MLGRPLATSQASHERLPKRLALAVFSSDALSSTAYATEEILRILLIVGAANLRLSWGIAVGIAVLLAIVTISYRQTIFAYPNGGGAYIVARENLGDTPGLIAAGSLLIDYILTVAVSTAAGVAALVSAFNGLQPYTVWLCLFFVGLVTYANLRGLKESGAIFAIPTYSFIFSMAALVVIGLFKSFTTPAVVNPAAEEAVRAALSEHHLQTVMPLTLFVLLRAFASGCTALAGVEAISNGIPAFRKPESQNAAKTLTLMSLILGTLFLGLTWIANHFHVPALPEDGRNYETVVSQLAALVFGGRNIFYYITQFATAAILIVAANTAFAGFPRLTSLLAQDRFLPRQLDDLGDRLVFNNGILVLAFVACILLILFKGSVTSLLPLYAVGVFTSFTLSQAGMVRHWLRQRGPGWLGSAAINLIGAIATGVVMGVIAVTKFDAGEPTGLRFPFGQDESGRPGISINYGAWLVIALIPLLVVGFRKIRGHYAEVARSLHASTFRRVAPDTAVHHTVLVLVSGLHRGIFPALEYARSLSPDARAVYIELEPARTANIKEEWERFAGHIPLVILESPYRNLREPIVEYIEQVKDERDDDVVTVVMPELVSVKKWWHRLLHNTSAQAIRRSLELRHDVVLTSYRYFAEEPEGEAALPAAPPPARDTVGSA